MSNPVDLVVRETSKPPPWAGATRFTCRVPAMRVLEIRTYRLCPSSLDAFDRLMVDRAVPLLRSAGIDVVRCERSRAAEDGFVDYVLVRAFDDLVDREKREDAFYSSSSWREGPGPAIVAAIDTYHTVVLTVPACAIEQLAASA